MKSYGNTILKFNQSVVLPVWCLGTQKPKNKNLKVGCIVYQINLFSNIFGLSQ